MLLLEVEELRPSTAAGKHFFQVPIRHPHCGERVAPGGSVVLLDDEMLQPGDPGLREESLEVSV